MTIRTALHLALVTFIALPAGSGFINAAVLDFIMSGNEKPMRLFKIAADVSHRLAFVLGRILYERLLIARHDLADQCRFPGTIGSADRNYHALTFHHAGGLITAV